MDRRATCPRLDSNQHYTGFEAADSSDWSTRARRAQRETAWGYRRDSNPSPGESRSPMLPIHHGNRKGGPEETHGAVRAFPRARFVWLVGVAPTALRSQTPSSPAELQPDRPTRSGLRRDSRNRTGDLAVPNGTRCYYAISLQPCVQVVGIEPTASSSLMITIDLRPVLRTKGGRRNSRSTTELHLRDSIIHSFIRSVGSSGESRTLLDGDMSPTFSPEITARCIGRASRRRWLDGERAANARGLVPRSP